MKLRSRVLVPCVVAAVALAGCSTGADEDGAADAPVNSEDTGDTEDTENTGSPVQAKDPESLNYVALGDSFAAMGGSGTDLHGPEFCLRSTENYPALLEATEDVSCQGAVTEDIVQPRDTGEEQLPAQADALNQDTELITLSIGGNDIGFGEIAGCIQRAALEEDPEDCSPELDGPIREDLAQLPAKLDAVHADIQQRTDDAVVLVTGYLPLVTEGECEELDFVSEADRVWASELTAEVNATVQEAAESHGAEFVLPDGSAHTACAEPSERWADVLGINTEAYPMHLTPAGHEALAEAIRDQLAD